MTELTDAYDDHEAVLGDNASTNHVANTACAFKLPMDQALHIPIQRQPAQLSMNALCLVEGSRVTSMTSVNASEIAEQHPAG